MRNKVSLSLFSILWIISACAVVSSVHSWHFISFQAVDSSAPLQGIVNFTDQRGVVHFLTPKCSCSNFIFDHLIKRGPLKEEATEELLVIIDNNDNPKVKKLEEMGFQIKYLTKENLRDKYNDTITGVPLLVIFDEEKQLTYAGGYTDKLITPFTKIDIKFFLSKQDENKKLDAFPIRGCAVSQQIQKIIDPLGLKYTQL